MLRNNQDTEKRNAVKARMKAEEQYFGEHAFINRDENYQKFKQKIWRKSSI